MDPRPDTHDPERAADQPAAPAVERPAHRRPRPMIERIGLAGIALVMASLFAAVGVASFIGSEPFLGVMGLIGCLMVLWVGALTLIRG